MSNTKERAKTMSKHFYDDEIKFVDQVTGDIHLKDGVRRLKYISGDQGQNSSPMNESYVNNDELMARNRKELSEKLGLKDAGMDDI